MTATNGGKVYDSELMRALGRHHEQLKPALKKVSAFLQASPYLSATLNIEELAAATQTSTAAVNRLAHVLGLNGFTGLRLALMENLLAVVSLADVIENKVKQSPGTLFGLAEQLELSKSHLDNLARMNEPETLQTMAHLIAGARTVFVVGLGNSFHLASLLAASLSPFCTGVHSVAMDAGIEGAAHRLSAITERDVLLAIAMPAYTRDTIRLAQFAKSRNACVLSLTDCPASPLTTVACLSLFVPPAHPVLATSRVGLMAVIEALISQVRQQAPEQCDPAPMLPADVLTTLRSDARAHSFELRWREPDDTFPGDDLP
jgi:DNA-binding MurR/RpiR family transcriptional regulator